MTKQNSILWNNHGYEWDALRYNHKNVSQLAAEQPAFLPESLFVLFTAMSGD